MAKVAISFVWPQLLVHSWQWIFIIVWPTTRALKVSGVDHGQLWYRSCGWNCHHGMDLPSISSWMLTQFAKCKRTDRHSLEPAPPNRIDSRDSRDSARHVVCMYSYSILNLRLYGRRHLTLSIKFSIRPIGVVAKSFCQRHFCHFIVLYYFEVLFRHQSWMA